MTDGQQLILDFVLGGFAFLILRCLDHWFHRSKGGQADLLEPAEQIRNSANATVAQTHKG